MNLFILEYRNENESIEDWCFRNGESHCDQHNKLVLEAWQQLNTCANVLNIKTDSTSVAYMNHPCTKFTRASLGNWQFVYHYASGLANSMAKRYGKTELHKSFQRIEKNIPYDANGLLSGDMTDFVVAAPQWIKDKHSDAIAAYREYYCKYKSWFARKDRNNDGKFIVYPSSWKHGIIPSWFVRFDPLLAIDSGYVDAWIGNKKIVLTREMVSNLSEL